MDDEYTLKPFRPEDAVELCSLGIDARAFMIGPSQKAEDYKTNCPGFTGRKNGEIVACGGVFILWPGVAEAWMMPTKLIRKEVRFVFRMVSNALQSLALGLDLHRVQAVALEGFPESGRWLKHLGFHEEGQLERYGPNEENYTRYVWFPKG